MALHKTEVKAIPLVLTKVAYDGVGTGIVESLFLWPLVHGNVHVVYGNSGRIDGSIAHVQADDANILSDR